MDINGTTMVVVDGVRYRRADLTQELTARIAAQEQQAAAEKDEADKAKALAQAEAKEAEEARKLAEEEAKKAAEAKERTPDTAGGDVKTRARTPGGAATK